MCVSESSKFIFFFVSCILASECGTLIFCVLSNGKRWIRPELLLALDLYNEIDFGLQHSENIKVQRLAEFLDRTAGSVNMKLNNFAALDPSLDRKGLSNYSNKDEEVWKQFWDDLDTFAPVVQELNDQVTEQKDVNLTEVLERAEKSYGTEETTEAKRRIGQRFFRRVVLSNYGRQCAVCRLAQPPLLDAAHIVSWKEAGDPSVRVHPRNGLALCAIHHRGFDTDRLRIHPESLTVRVSQKVREEETTGAKLLFQRFHETELHVPEKQGPATDFLSRTYEKTDIS